MSTPQPRFTSPPIPQTSSLDAHTRHFFEPAGHSSPVDARFKLDHPAFLEWAASPWKRKAQKGRRPPRLTQRHLRLDRGYSSIEKEYPQLEWVRILTALKGTRYVKVTPLGHTWNQVMVSPKRMQVEQNIGHMKNWRVLSGLYRARLHAHQDTLALVAGLHNFTILKRLAWQP